MSQEPRSLSLSAADGRALAATHFPASGDKVVVVVPAIGVPQRYYRHFAAALQARGTDVLTFDYRGIGQSADRPIRQEDATMEAWGRSDLVGALAHARTIAPRQVLVGHSVGGSLLAFVPDLDGVVGAYNVAPQEAYLPNFSGADRLAAELAMRILLPLAALLLGYLPGWALGSESLPRGVALDWSRWSQSPGFVLSADPVLAPRLEGIRFPVVVVGMSDDLRFSPPRAVDGYERWFDPSIVTRHTVTPEDAGGPVGHFGFFKPKFADTLWPHAFEHITSM
jgi:predicted alpha/beta hydrolase